MSLSADFEKSSCICDICRTKLQILNGLFSIRITEGSESAGQNYKQKIRRIKHVIIEFDHQITRTRDRYGPKMLSWDIWN